MGRGAAMEFVMMAGAAIASALRLSDLVDSHSLALRMGHVIDISADHLPDVVCYFRACDRRLSPRRVKRNSTRAVRGESHLAGWTIVVKLRTR